MGESDPILEMRGVTKTFPGVVANDDISFSVNRGEIHGLLGENGAGKSTLMKVLYGLYSADDGEILLNGEPLALESPQDAIEAGIGMVHQHFKLIPRLSVVENVILGYREPAEAVAEVGGSGPLGSLVGGLASRFSFGTEGPAKRVRALAGEYGLDIDPTAKVWELDIGQQQRVEILKALYRDVDLLILDEPTAVLTPNEARQMFQTLRRLVDQGLTIIFITHKLSEVTEITDRVTVLRDGVRVDTVETDAYSQSELAELMVGREVLFSVAKDAVPVGEEVLAVQGLRARSDRNVEAVTGIDLTVRAGEIVGVAGVSGNGQRELAECLAGVRDPTAGHIAVNGTNLARAGPRAFVDQGVSYVPEDRHRYGCATSLNLTRNAISKEYRDETFGRRGLLDYRVADEYAETLVEEYDVRGVTDVAEITAGELSGGNLQKLILARELHRDPDLLVANQPTRGVDVGAIEFLRQAIIEQRSEGTGVLFFSEDLDEIFDVADRVLVMYEGEIVHETTPDEADRERIGLEMTGGDAATATGGGSP